MSSYDPYLFGCYRILSDQMKSIATSFGILRIQTLLALLFLCAPFVSAQQQDPFAINGGSILAMAGKDSVAVAVDKRFGSGPQVRLLTGAVNCEL